MARKPLIVQIDTAQVQGDGSYIEFRRLTWGERREARDKATKLKDAKFEEWAFKFLLDHLVGWNWTDTDGKTLPLPSKPEDLETLIDEEFDLLLETVVRAMKGNLVYDDEAKKN